MRKYGGSADEVLAYARDVARSRLAGARGVRRRRGIAGGDGRGGAGRRGRPPRRVERGAAAARPAGRGAASRRSCASLAMPHATFVHRGDRARRRLGRPRAVAAPTRWSSSSAPTRACRRGRCARPPPAASSRARCSPSAASSTSATTWRRSSSTRSTPGIGGVTAAALGERLRRLAERRQVLCITHLPQVAAFADRQFAIAKESDVGDGTTETVVRQVEGEERLAELCRMLGAAPDDEAARQPRRRACWPRRRRPPDRPGRPRPDADARRSLRRPGPMVYLPS